MTAAAIKTLKDYANDGEAIQNFSEVLEHIKEETDRATVVILSAHLEDKLEAALRKRINPAKSKDSTNRLFEYNGPLGTFSARIEIAHAFAVIEKATCAQLHTFRELRNACAHSRRPISLQVAELKTAVEAFNTAPNSFHEQLVGKVKHTNVRSQMVLEVVMLTTAIRTGSREEAVKRMTQVLEKNRKAKTDVA
jgi:DNA-binding MltR family transcriptional regulator